MLTKSLINHIQLSGPGIYYEELGGYYVGLFKNDILNYLLVISPKDLGEYNIIWKINNTRTKGSFSELDGEYNMRLLRNSQHPVKRWCANLLIDGFTDWYIPSINELKFIRELPLPKGRGF